MFALPSITRTPLIHALKPSSYWASSSNRLKSDAFVTVKFLRKKTAVYPPLMSGSVVTRKFSPYPIGAPPPGQLASLKLASRHAVAGEDGLVRPLKYFHVE